MVVEYGVINFFNQNNSHIFIFHKFLISVEMVVEYGVINFYNQKISQIFIFPNLPNRVEMVVEYGVINKIFNQNPKSHSFNFQPK